jgi:hypothetical protein
MFRSILLAAAATVFLPVSGSALAPHNAKAASAAQAARPFNIGFVLYTRGDAPGTLTARWNYANAYSGLGAATGGPVAQGFAGRYHVRYFLENGRFSDEYDLDIERHAPGDFYDVTWIAGGKVSARGVGMEVANGKSLAVGWRRIAD